jgi:hypothetical protein
MTNGQWRFIELFLQSRGAVVIHVTATDDQLCDRVHQRGDDLVAVDPLAGIRSSFYGAMDDSLLACECVYAEDVDVASIIALAHRHELDARHLVDHVTYVGPPRPHRLLLGDVRGPMFRTDDPVDKLRPAFMPVPGTSGAYLWDVLGTAPRIAFMGDAPFTGGIGVANACDVDHPARLIESLNVPPRVTALGRNAQRAVPAASRAPHPQYVRRFHHGRAQAYMYQLTTGMPYRWN